MRPLVSKVSLGCDCLGMLTLNFHILTWVLVSHRVRLELGRVGNDAVIQWSCLRRCSLLRRGEANVVIRLIGGRSVLDSALVDLQELTLLDVLRILWHKLLRHLLHSELLLGLLRCHHLLLLPCHKLEYGVIWRLSILVFGMHPLVVVTISVYLFHTVVQTMSTWVYFPETLLMLRCWNHSLQFLLVIEVVHTCAKAWVLRLWKVPLPWDIELVIRWLVTCNTSVDALRGLSFRLVHYRCHNSSRPVLPNDLEFLKVLICFYIVTF